MRETFEVTETRKRRVRLPSITEIEIDGVMVPLADVSIDTISKYVMELHKALLAERERRFVARQLEVAEALKNKAKRQLAEASYKE